jgi:hypothetical protein
VKNRKTVYNGKLDIRWQIQVITISRTSKGIIAHKKKKKKTIAQTIMWMIYINKIATFQ